METINVDLIDILGKEYIIGHIVSEIRKQTEQRLLNIYITDALRMLVNNTAQKAFEKQSYMRLTKRWLDMVEPQVANIPENNKNCKEVVKDIWNNIRRGRG